MTKLTDQIKELLDQIPTATTSHGKIGLGFTTHNRPELFKKSYEQTKLISPEIETVVVDDASRIPVDEATYRFETNVGIARAKNKCLELLYLSGCEHIILMDDDTYPLTPNWYEPYINSSEPHLMYIFKDFATGRKIGDTNIVYQNDEIIAYNHPRGCMLYYHRSVLDKVGGMDTVFTKWGFEHGNLSDRIFMAGLTSFRYMDVANSKGLIYSNDEHQENRGSTVVGKERIECIKKNEGLYNERKFKSYYAPFIEKENVFLTCYFTGVGDPQRQGKKWEAKLSELQPLINSVKSSRLIVLHDCFDDVKDTDKVEFVRVTTNISPYFERWVAYRKWMTENKEWLGNVFCIDATDVEILREPDWDSLGDMLWTGDENEVVGCEWMRKHHGNRTIQEFIAANKDKQLLNAGVVGGRVDVVGEFIRQMVDFISFENAGETDMGLFNYMAYSNWSGRIRNGRGVTTVFKGFEKDNKVSWLRHK